MNRLKIGKVVALAMLSVLAAPAQVAAQEGVSSGFSDGYRFLKAVKERDGAVATDLIVAPGSVVINYKDPKSGDGALHMLARDRDITWLTFMLGKGAKANLQNRDGTTALAVAAQIGWVEGADRLLRSGANVDLPNDRGETPLILAVQNRDLSMVRLLVSKGANPKKTDNVAGYSALDYARRDGRSPAIVKLLEEPQAASRPIAGPRL